MAVETVYRVTMFYEGDVGKVEAAYFNQPLTASPEITNQEAFSGCPAAGPYLTVECTDIQRARLVEKRLRTIIRKAGANVVHD